MFFTKYLSSEGFASKYLASKNLRDLLIPPLIIAAGLLLGTQNVRAGSNLDVVLYQAQIFEMPEGTSTLIVGNPIIADVTILKKGNKMLVTGKGFGETNLLALDNAGNLIVETKIRVSSSTAQNLTVQRGAERESYSCSPRCQPTVSLGDSPRFVGEVTGQIQANTTSSTQGAR